MLKYYHCLQRNQKPRKALLHLACEVFCLRKTVKDGIINTVIIRCQVDVTVRKLGSLTVE